MNDINKAAKPSCLERKRQQMKNKILKQLFYKGERSIPEISKKIGKTIPTTTTLIDELLAEDLITEQGEGSSSGGRKPKLYAVNKNAWHVLIVNVKKNAIDFGVYNMHLELICDIKSIPFSITDLSNNMQILLSSLEQYISNNHSFTSKILGVGVCMPGLIDKKDHSNISYFAAQGDKLVSSIEKVVKKPVFLDNDTRVMTLGEFRFGQARGRSNIVCVNYDLGIGAGFVFNGSIYTGKSGFAGELGHIQIKPNGELCYCGKLGCIETVASGKYIINQCIDALKSNSISQLQSVYQQKGDLNLNDVVSAINNGDELSTTLLSNAADELGRGLSLLVHLLNPEMIVLNGKLSKTGKYLQIPVQHAISKYSLSSIHDDVEVVISDLGENALYYGLIAQVIDNCLR